MRHRSVAFGRRGHEEGTPPLRDDESIVSGCIVTKVADRSKDKILDQLVSNMTVCIAKSLEAMTAPDLKSLKVASCYGLILDYLQPIELYKYSMNFEAGERSLVLKLSHQKFSGISHEVTNRSITYMLKKFFHTYSHKLLCTLLFAPLIFSHV